MTAYAVDAHAAEEKIRFRAAMEVRDLEAVVESFTPDATIHSPISPTLKFSGREQTKVLFGSILATFNDLNYTQQLRHGDVGILVLQARVGKQPIEVVEYMRLAEDGRISELTAFFRPLPALAIATRGMAREIARRRNRVLGWIVALLCSTLIWVAKLGDATVVRLIRALV